MLGKRASDRLGKLFSDDISDDEEDVARQVRIAALSYSARFLRSIMADRAAGLLEDRVAELELEALELDDHEGCRGQTIIGVGVRPVPSAKHSFDWGDMADHKATKIEMKSTLYQCADPTCIFFEQPTQQGVCHDAEGDLIKWIDLDRIEKEAREMLDFYLQQSKNAEDYLNMVESMFITAWMNQTGTLDECVRLRAANALLKKKLEKLEHADV